MGTNLVHICGGTFDGREIAVAQIRSTPEEIDIAILDTAAGLFAVHGIERTTVQQIADAVGYSKTGLLHRFASKQAIADGVDAMIDTHADELLNRMQQAPVGPQRTSVQLGEIAAVAIRIPGAVQYLLSTIKSLEHLDRGDATTCGAAAVAGRVLEAIAGADATPEAELRLLLALQLVAGGAVIGAESRFLGLGNQLAPLLTALATQVVAGALDHRN